MRGVSGFMWEYSKAFVGGYDTNNGESDGKEMNRMNMKNGMATVILGESYRDHTVAAGIIAYQDCVSGIFSYHSIRHLT